MLRKVYISGQIEVFCECMPAKGVNFNDRGQAPSAAPDSAGKPETRPMELDKNRKEVVPGVDASYHTLDRGTGKGAAGLRIACTEAEYGALGPDIKFLKENLDPAQFGGTFSTTFDRRGFMTLSVDGYPQNLDVNVTQVLNTLVFQISVYLKGYSAALKDTPEAGSAGTILNPKQNPVWND